MTSYPLNDQQHATVIAALRFYQEQGQTKGWRSRSIDAIATNDGTLVALDDEGINKLVEELQFPPVQLRLKPPGSKASAFQVIVGNIGTVYAGPLLREALSEYAEYRKQSVNNYGRAAGETVTLLRRGEIQYEYIPNEA